VRTEASRPDARTGAEERQANRGWKVRMEANTENTRKDHADGHQRRDARMRHAEGFREANEQRGKDMSSTMDSDLTTSMH
jgi:hypothetical protein